MGITICMATRITAVRSSSPTDTTRMAELIGLLNCGDCPGATVVTRLAQMNLWNAPMDEKPAKIHVGPCLTLHCPHKDTIVGKIKAKCGIETIEGTHPYLPENIFA